MTEALRRYRSVFPSLLLLALGLGLTAFAYLKSRAWVEQSLNEELRHQAEQIAARAQQQFDLQEETLRGLAGLFMASGEVGRTDFRTYVTELALAERFPAVVEFRFARYLGYEHIPAWRRQVAASLAAAGETPFAPEPKPGGRRDAYLLVEFTHPYSPASLGLDLLQSAERRQAIARIREGTGFALSEQLRAEYPTGAHYALMVGLPRGTKGDLRGTVSLIFRPDRLMDSLASDIVGLKLELYDRPVAASRDDGLVPVFVSRNGSKASAGGLIEVALARSLHARVPLRVGDAEWTLVVAALPDWAHIVQDSWFPLAVAAIGLLLSLLLSGFAALMVRGRLRAEARYHDLVFHLPVPTFAMDREGGLLFISPQIETFTGWPADHYLAQPKRWLEHLHPEDRERLRRDIAAAVADQGLYKSEIRWQHRDGHMLWLHLEGHVAEGELKGALFDITRQREAEEALRRLNQELEARVAERTQQLQEMLDQRQEFLATMSHEIRTPLTGLLGMLELMSLAPLRPDERHQLAIARESGKALARIIDDILDYSKMQAGKLALSPQPESLNALIESVRDAYLALASAKGISLMTFVDPRLPPVVIMDELRVRQILQNFLSNALKFTADGYVELRAEWLGEGEGGVTLKLSVRDSGIGIAPELQRQLFERYTQADAATARRYGGTGLGLAISKRLAEMMGGSIGVESAPAKGSTFYVILTLPVAEGAPLPKPSAGETLRRLDAGGRPVLVVDDHPTNRVLIARQLALLGLTAELAENGNQALAKWKRADYALIITDVHMPVMDGYDLAQAVRAAEAQEGRKHTPIIAWTAAAMTEETARCRAAGMDDVLVKPTDLATLRATLARWLPFAANSEASLPMDDAVLDRNTLAQLAESSEEERLILADFVEQTRRDLALLEAAIERGDAAAASREAHRIKGAAKMVGAARLASRAARAEEAALAHELEEVAQRRRELEADLAEIVALEGLSVPPRQEEAGEGAPPVWDPGVLAGMVGESPRLQREVIGNFFENAAEAIREMQAAYEKREARALAKAARKLKSAARAMGAQQLAGLCAEIEAAGNNTDWEAAARSYQRLDDAWTNLSHQLKGSGE